MSERGSGILLHISSLPSRYGIGDFGPSAYQFADFLASAKQKYWQLLPLNPTDTVYGNSPYSSNSAFALNSLFISPEILEKEGLLESSSINFQSHGPHNAVDYVQVSRLKSNMLDQAYENFLKKNDLLGEFNSFCAEHDWWLDDYALFRVLKDKFSGSSWNQWPEDVRNRSAKTLKAVKRDCHDSIEKIKVIQFLLLKQWNALRKYCLKKKIKIIGDIPIYVNYDSADVWANPDIFKLNDDGTPTFVAGVPPDYFSTTGQRWGNPVYNWDKLQEREFDWWIQRVKHNLTLFDCIRIDHFRGFVACWEIPSSEETAVNGQWVDGPAEDFFMALRSIFPKLPIIAEDLGIITPEVTAVMQEFHFPGMKVLLFAFDGDLTTHPYIPENYKTNCIVYTGTHDNNTVLGWFKNDARDKEKQNLIEYFNGEIPEDEIAGTLVELAMKSKAKIAIIPLQDILGLDKDGRMNIPGTSSGNWVWRFTQGDLTQEISRQLLELTSVSKRI